MITTKRINPLNPNERKTYSTILRQFEAQFLYPLGKQHFTIVHGFSQDWDYFSYFETLGTPSVMVLEKDDTIIGAICAVLRSVEEQKIWYLCDYKIHPTYRGQKLYRKLMVKHFLYHYLQSNKMYGLNMSEPKNNGLVLQAQRVFKIFNVKVKPLYLHQCSMEYYVQNPLTSFYPYSTAGLKDIFIEGKPYPIVHLLDSKAQTRIAPNRLTPIDLSCSDPTSQVMLLSPQADSIFEQGSVQKVSFIHRYGDFFIPSSAEI